MVSFSHKPTLTGDLVVLRPVRREDAAWYATRGDHEDRVELEVYAFNPRARHVYERVGFVHEGTRRDALRWDGAWIDAHVMAMPEADWRRRAAAPAAARP